MESGSDLSSRAVASQVLSTRKSLTAVFGMGTGVASLPLPPEIWKHVCKVHGEYLYNHTERISRTAFTHPQTQLCLPVLIKPSAY